MSTSSTTCIADLPSEVLKDGLSKFLDGRDATRFQSSCKLMYKSMDLAVVTKNALLRPLKDRWSWNDRNDAFHLWTRLDLAIPHKVHSVLFTCRFKDQGWGNRKSSIQIAEIQEEEEDGDGMQKKFICESPVAEHHWTDVKFEFQADPEKKYSLWYHVGGGGGHELFVQNVSVQTLVHGSIYAKLANADLPLMNDFFRNMFKLVIRMISENGESRSNCNNDERQQYPPLFLSLIRDSLDVDVSIPEHAKQIAEFVHDYEYKQSNLKEIKESGDNGGEYEDGGRSDSDSEYEEGSSDSYDEYGEGSSDSDY